MKRDEEKCIHSARRVFPGKVATLQDSQLLASTPYVHCPPALIDPL